MRTPARGPATAPRGGDAPLGSVYGYAVRSPEPLRYLRAPGRPGAGPVLRVEVADDGVRPSGEPLRRWVPRPGNPFRAHLFAEGPWYRLWIDGVGWYRIAPDANEVWLPPDADPLRREERLYGIPLALLVSRRGALPLHAATVGIGDGAVAIAAPGRHGKTTLAAALMAAGHRLLSEDVSCCTLDDDPAVLPGPALLRVRPDALERLELASAAVTFADRDRIHLALPEGERGDCSPVPLRAIFLLRPGDERPRATPVAPHAAVRDLWALSTKLPTEDDRARCFAGVATLVDRVPTYDLSRPNRWELLPATAELVAEVATS
ncbi:MAG: hypothetical protein KatS3mg014_1666 [Actinomycetota bacterium]|nr:MAG: hypothetical protein KatS3mg014_1666 [Actinomycetota bacterium]